MKKLLTAMTACCFLMGILLGAAPATAPEGGTGPPGGGGAVFSDVPDSHWAAGKIRLLAGKKCIYGYADGTFLPESPLTRAELAAILAGAAGNRSLPGERTPVFSDVSRDQWFYNPVSAAGKYFSSDPSPGKGIFRPDDPVTRQEAVAAVVMAKNLHPAGVDPMLLQESFTDYQEITPVYRDAISLAVIKKLTRGFPDKTFRPEDGLTRAEAAALIYSAFFSEVSLNTLIKTGSLKFFDASQDNLASLAGSLNGRFGKWEDVEISFYAREESFSGSRDDKLIVVMARVDPFKYFTFSDAVFKPDPGSVQEFAEKVSSAVNQFYPGRRNIVMVGFWDLQFYDTVPKVYGQEYTRYSPADGGWRIERFYAGAMSQDGRVAETWLEPNNA